MRRALEIALVTYLVPLASTRALRVGLLLLLGFLGVIGLAVVMESFSEWLSASTLESLRRFAIVPGVPLAAILLSEMPIRDGIRQRTLLYPLLGPVPRFQLALVRTVATAVLLAVGTAVVVLLVRVLGGSGAGLMGREMLAALLGAGTYVGLFGLVHLVTRRGLIGGLALYGLFDEPLSRLPFALRNLSPSYHMRVIADQTVEISLPLPIAPAASSVPVSSLILLALAVGLIAMTAGLFTRKGLGEIC